MSDLDGTEELAREGSLSVRSFPAAGGVLLVRDGFEAEAIDISPSEAEWLFIYAGPMVAGAIREQQIAARRHGG